jgi:1,4-dihydroxy-2-naphthoyl-CoA hydrolase
MPSKQSRRTKTPASTNTRKETLLVKSDGQQMSERARLVRSSPNNAHEVVLNGGMARTLGVRLLTVTRKRVTAEMPISAKHMNRSGRVNGGALMAFADALGATGTVANLPAGHRTTTLESKTNFFAAGEAPVLKAVSKPLHIGRTTMVWQTTIRNADRRLVAVVTQTQMVLPSK